MSNKTKEELVSEWRSKHSRHSRMCPSEQFVEENSGKTVESVSSEAVFHSVAEETPHRDPTVPEKTHLTIHDICHYCSKPLGKGHSQFKCAQTVSNPTPERTTVFDKKDKKWISDFVKYQNSFDDEDEGEKGE